MSYNKLLLLGTGLLIGALTSSSSPSEEMVNFISVSYRVTQIFNLVHRGVLSPVCLCCFCLNSVNRYRQALHLLHANGALVFTLDNAEATPARLRRGCGWGRMLITVDGL